MKKKININEFRSQKADFIRNVKSRSPKKWDDLNNEISLYCSCFGLPVICAVIFAEEEFPMFKDELAYKKSIVMEFYGYEICN